MAVAFYDMKTRVMVDIDETQIEKFTAQNGEIRYGLRVKLPDGRQLTKFVTKEDLEKLRLPITK